MVKFERSSSRRQSKNVIEVKADKLIQRYEQERKLTDLLEQSKQLEVVVVGAAEEEASAMERLR